MINKLICVCCRKDAETFQIAAKYICEYVDARIYVVLVPLVDYEYFSSLDLQKFKVVSEDKYADIAGYLRRKRRGSRFGWYFQQFIKMSEIDEGLDSDINLIWDADTIPLKELSFLINGKVAFYQGKEFHLPYFELIKCLINEDKLVNSSFIAQCLPYRVKWFREFKKNLECDSQCLWYQKIIDSINFSEDSGFSEYETLGTFAIREFDSEVYIRGTSENWYRYGNSLIGTPNNVELYKKALSKKYDFISFESWDKRRFSLFRRFIKLYL